MLKAVILNDTRRNRDHPGCIEVMSTIEFLSNLNSIEIIKSYERTDASSCEGFEEEISKCNAVLLNGEGTFHHDQTEAIQLAECIRIAHGMGKPCHLINCTWESNHVVNSMLPILSSISVRDSRSQKQIQSLGFDATVSPDLSLYKRGDDLNIENKSRKITFIDSVNWRTTKHIAAAAASVDEDLYVMGPAYWKKLKYATAHIQLGLRGRRVRKAYVPSLQGLIVTGRFHGLCLAIRRKLPFIAIPSNTPKLESLISDIGLPRDKFVIDASNISRDAILRFVSSRNPLNRSENSLLSSYLEHAQSSSMATFKQIAKLT